jgi:hypothetical protein
MGFCPLNEKENNTMNKYHAVALASPFLTPALIKAEGMTKKPMGSTPVVVNHATEAESHAQQAKEAATKAAAEKPGSPQAKEHHKTAAHHHRKAAQHHTKPAEEHGKEIAK